MKCCDCGKEMLKRRGYSEKDDDVGLIKTDGEYWECPECGCQLVPSETLQVVDDIRKDRTDRLLWMRAGSPDEFNRQYISTKEAATILGLSYQTGAKSEILRYAIYNLSIYGIRYWLKESVERYRDTGNGWFPLIEPQDDVTANCTGHI